MTTLAAPTKLAAMKTLTYRRPARPLPGPIRWKTRSGQIALAALLLAVSSAQAEAPFTYVGRVGLTISPEFTASTSRQGTGVLGGTNPPQTLTESGRIFGLSTRYTGGTEFPDNGTAGWTASALTGVTTRIGLFDQGGGNEFTSSFNKQVTQVSQTTESGFAAGYSTRYSGSSEVGSGAYFYNPATHTSSRIGFYDQSGGNTFTSSEQRKTSSVVDLNNVGKVVGVSTIYDGGLASSGQAAWVADGLTGVSTQIGLVGVGYTRGGGGRNSGVNEISESGYIVGNSARGDGTNPSYLGQAIWGAFASTGATTRLGLFDTTTGIYTSSTGVQSSTARLFGGKYLQESGYVAGDSARYAVGATNTNGDAQWIANVATGATFRVGLYDASGGNEFTGNFGGSQTSYQTGFLEGLNEAGQAIGKSYRYNGGNSNQGEAAWVANGATGATTRIGFYDAGGGTEFRSASGLQFSNTIKLTESGYIIGSSWRFDGQAYTSTSYSQSIPPSRGYAAWVANAATGTTTRLGRRSTSPSRVMWLGIRPVIRARTRWGRRHGSRLRLQARRPGSDFMVRRNLLAWAPRNRVRRER
jgi:hypothetical protein